MLRVLGVTVLIAVALAGCGGSSDSEPKTSEAKTSEPKTTADGRTRLSDHDREVAIRSQVHVRQWNTTAGEWIAALQEGPPERFERVSRKLNPRLNRIVARLSTEALKYENARLRRGMSRLAAAYRQEFYELVNLREAAVEGDRERALRLQRKLRRMAQAKTEMGLKLFEEFPELA